MKIRGFLAAVLLCGLAAPASTQERVTLGWGRMFTNDGLGDLEDRWRTGSYTVSRVRGPSWSGELPGRFGEILEFRARAEIIAPENLTVAAPGDRRYAGIPIPQTESLKDTIARVLPAFDGLVVPELKAGRRVVIAAHGNSIRALVKYLDGISDDEIVGLNIPNGIPLVYELDDDLKPLRHYYLGDAEAAAKAAAAVASQGKA